MNKRGKTFYEEGMNEVNNREHRQTNDGMKDYKNKQMMIKNILAKKFEVKEIFAERSIKSWSKKKMFIQNLIKELRSEEFSWML